MVLSEYLKSMALIDKFRYLFVKSSIGRFVYKNKLTAPKFE